MSPTRFIDVHHHIIPDRYLTAVGAHAVGAQGSTGRVPKWSVQAALDGMDEAGIQVAITSISSPGFRGLTQQAEAELARWCNDFAADLVGSHPDRFGMFAALPLQNLDACLLETRHALDTLAADGLCLLSNYGGRYLGDAYFSPLYEELNKRAAVVFVHPTAARHEVKIDRLSSSMLEFPFDTTRTIASLIFGGVITRYPSIRWVFSHAGGAIPYLCGRIDTLSSNNPALQELLPAGLLAELKKLYFDCALSTAPNTMQMLAAQVGPGRILFGSDFPFGPKKQMQVAVDGVRQLTWSDADKQQLAVSNAMSLFPQLASRLMERAGGVR